MLRALFFLPNSASTLCQALYWALEIQKEKKIEHSSYPSRDRILMTEAVMQLSHREIVIVIIVLTEWS